MEFHAGTSDMFAWYWYVYRAEPPNSQLRAVKWMVFLISQPPCDQCGIVDLNLRLGQQNRLAIRLIRTVKSASCLSYLDSGIGQLSVLLGQWNRESDSFLSYWDNGIVKCLYFQDSGIHQLLLLLGQWNPPAVFLNRTVESAIFQLTLEMFQYSSFSMSIAFLIRCIGCVLKGGRCISVPVMKRDVRWSARVGPRH